MCRALQYGVHMTRTADPTHRALGARAAVREDHAMGHPNGRAERMAERTRRAFVPAWSGRAGTRYHARTAASYTLGDTIRADVPQCRYCDARPMMLGDDVCAECMADRRARNERAPR